MARRLAVVAEHGDRTVLYVRVSALMGRDGETFHSPELQTKAMRELVARRGLREVAVVEDLDVSGRTFERAGIQRVLEMARDGQLDVVALYDLSRLGRNTAESLRTIAELRDLHVTVISTVEQIDDTPEGQFQLGVFLGMAQLYSDQISRRWHQVIAHRLEQGRMHGAVPVGYRRDETGEIVVDPVMAPAVVEVFRRYAAGERLWHIARDWRARSGGRHGSYMALKRILRNPAYIGKVHVRGEVCPGRHEPIVSEAMFAKVARRAEAESRTPPRRLALANPFAGLAVCDECDSLLQRHHNAARGDTVLQCRTAKEMRTCAGPGAPLLGQVEAAVLAELERHANGLTDVAAQAARRAAKAQAKVDVSRLRRSLSKTEAALARAATDYAKRDMTSEEYQAAAGALRSEITALREQLATSEQGAAAPAPEGVGHLTAALVRRWPRMTAEEKNRALKPLVRQVRVRRAAIYREPVQNRVHVELW